MSEEKRYVIYRGTGIDGDLERRRTKATKRNGKKQ